MTSRDPVSTRLLDAADSILFINGPVSTRVEEILQEAAASPASLYAHFGSKDGLIVAALQRRLKVWDRAWSEAIIAAPTPEDKLLAIFPALATYQREYLRERWCAFCATTATYPHPGADLEEVLAAEDALLTGRLRELAQPIAGDSAADLAELIEVAYCGTLTLMLRGSDEVAVERGWRAARTLLQSFNASQAR